MYICQDCGLEFSNPEYITETHLLDLPPFEVIRVCPNCKSSNLKKPQVLHCHCCGRRLPYGVKEYCNSLCRRRGELMWQEQAKRRNIKYRNPLERILREVEEYNNKNGTRYSYGMYVAKCEGGKKKYDDRRKEKIS